ncbi:hypothetical protein [Kitasatospora sp. NPDC088134]|uniref:hypothetical protein n=1 Tax=Kitasatospora sp. NPDC088134 TaxID=3364071 RepID=UPI00381ECB52
MSGGFRIDPEALGKAAEQAHAHADRVEQHGRNLDARTRGKLLGKGRLGQIVQRAVRPVLDSMIKDMSKAMAGGHRSIGHGLQSTRKNLDAAEESIRTSFRHRAKDRDGLEINRGDSVLGGEKGLRDQYRRRVATRIDGLRNQGHGPQRHLDPTDDMLKARLGTPTPPHMANGQPAYHRMPGGYIQTQNKIDPAHGPNPQERLQGDALYRDAEKPDRRHKCDSFSTAFKEGEDESFMYADLHARSRLDPDDPGPQKIVFSPEDAWGPGNGHHRRFRGFYVDPANPVDQHGNVNYKPVDFRDAKIEAYYERDGKGGHRLVTMFPQPQRVRNR